MKDINYDIFISYRQKDNKGDRWVSEFVDALKDELESTFKEEISVYFDINPHDGLLETHDVDASLKEKLKCLVCIPIISRTYCDPESFAWEHEFKAFVEQASRDQFGLKVKLSGGNIANRILPIRIHDLDQTDIRLFESTIGGVLRSIDFVYKETGVNRQLRAKDDDIIKNPGQILYRDQINKVALAVKDIIESMKLVVAAERVNGKDIPATDKGERKYVLQEETVNISKNQTKEKISTKEIKPEQEKNVKPSPKKGIIRIASILILLIILVPVIILFNNRAKVSWAKEKAIPEIKRLIDEENEENLIKAYDLIQKVQKYISKDPDFKEMKSYLTGKLTILTNPSNADVYIRRYAGNEGEWEKVGKTPIDTLALQNWMFYQVKIVKAGYDDVLSLASTVLMDTLCRKMFKVGVIPPGMVYVDGIGDELISNFLRDKNGFFLDRYEVTNEQYKEFVNAGGYSNPVYWKKEFIKDGKTFTWKEAMSELIDKSSRPGPSTWEAGDYPDGQEDYPVSGVSWYEAAAYAEFAGKRLPTAYDWFSGAGLPYDYKTYGFNGSHNKIIPYSNFYGKGPAPVGKFPGMSYFGAYDMAGNVREWNWNKTEIGNIVWGGSWEDFNYMYSSWSQLPSFDRSSKNGFRCIKYINEEQIPQLNFQPIEVKEKRDYSKDKPVSESVFSGYKNQFLYDKTNLNAKTESIVDSQKDWILEKITFDAAYGRERVTALLFLPNNVSPPFQTLIYFPGSSAINSKDPNNEANIWMIDYLLKNGRAVVIPVYKGTYARNNGLTTRMGDPNLSHQFTEWLITWMKDLGRTIDYLYTRSDIDTSKIGYYGFSWGGEIAAYAPAIEQRLKLEIIILGGFWGKAFPEADQINYLPRIRIPVLMINGKYDILFPLENNVKPFFNLIGTPEKDKRLCIYDIDHSIYKGQLIKETLNWLDKYFGPVKPLQNK